MSKILKEIFPSSIMKFEKAKELLKDEEELYFLPVYEFDALLSYLPYSLEEVYIKQLRLNDETYFKKEDYEYVKIRKNRLLRLIDINNNELMTFRVSLDRVYYQKEDDIDLYLDKCITALSYENVLDNKEPYITIQLSRYEYEKYLVPFNDSFFEIIFSYEDNILGLRKSSYEEFLRYDFIKNIYNSNFIGEIFKEYKEEDNLKVSLKLLYYTNIIVPITYLYNYYFNEILKANIYGIEDILNSLDNIARISDNRNYIKAILKTGEFLEKIIDSADNIPDSKKEDYIITAQIIIEEELENQTRKEQKKLALDNDLKDMNKIKDKRNNELVEKFFNKIQIRKEIIDMYNNI